MEIDIPALVARGKGGTWQRNALTGLHSVANGAP